MKKYIFQDMSQEERTQMLMDNASSISNGDYSRKLTEDERNAYRKRICDIDIEIENIDEELTEIKKDFKDRKDPLVGEKKKLLTDVRSNFKIVSGKLYKLVDRDKKMVGFYNEDGELVEERRMTKEDNQISITEAFNTAANM